MAFSNTANSLEGIARKFFKFAKVISEIAIKYMLGTQKRKA